MAIADEGELSPKHRKFLDEYLRLNMNGTKAYKNVYGPMNDATAAAAATRVLKSVKAKTYIDEYFKQGQMGREEVLFRLTEQARGEHDRFITPDGVDLEALVTAGKAHLVKSVKPTRYGNAIEFYDAQSAAVHIGKHHGLFVERHEVTGKDGEPFLKGYENVSPDNWNDDKDNESEAG